MADHPDHRDQHRGQYRGQHWGQYRDLMRVVARPVLQTTRVALDMLPPPQCLACDALVSMPGTLCHACWDGAVFVSAPLCAACGT
ncbi:MAG: double zinc ribbon domain-containing protein, partial [Proteobacteria bacterium]|nr:double zinc ribbon domain-containing protein [Pseudomonadota bacterium]